MLRARDSGLLTSSAGSNQILGVLSINLIACLIAEGENASLRVKRIVLGEGAKRSDVQEKFTRRLKPHCQQAAIAVRLESHPFKAMTLLHLLADRDPLRVRTTIACVYGTSESGEL